MSILQKRKISKAPYWDAYLWDCTRKSNRFSEEKSEQIYESQKQRYQEEGIDLENFMVIMSEFVTGDVEEGSPLNPNSTYEDYMWILKRADSTSEWVLYERGY